MDINNQRALAALLVKLRRERRQQSGLETALVPPDTETAYRIASMVAENLGLQVVGWKIAAVKEEMQKALRTDAPIYGRVYHPPGLLPSGASVPIATQCSPIPEAEFISKLGSDLPPRARPYSQDEVDEAVASLHPGIELAECRFIHDENFPPLPAILADGSGGSALVVGDAIEGWRERNIVSQNVTLSSNGAPRRSGNAADALDHPLVPLTWLANELSEKGIGLKAGQVVSTGTLTGMLRPRAGETFVADFGQLGSVSATYT